MNISVYKESIKKIIDATNNEKLLKLWKTQLERDTENETEFSDSEWAMVEKGMEDIKNGDIISIEEFISKR